MANDFSGNTWLVDTVMASPYSGPVMLSGIWTKNAAAGNRLVITDGAGKTIFDIVAPGANGNLSVPRFASARGFQVTVLETGLLQLTPHRV